MCYILQAAGTYSLEQHLISSHQACQLFKQACASSEHTACYTARVQINTILIILQGYPLKKICEYATNRDFTDVIVFNENRKTVNGLLLVHLPGGPTAHFKLSSLKLSKDIQVHYVQLTMLARMHGCLMLHLATTLICACMAHVHGALQTLMCAHFWLCS